jgi:NAD(P)-dependent dehydrogenase (short-subunit alcohol dehydrogenase family)
MSKVWLITGASKGFGRVWAKAALERGDGVAATARNTSALDDLAAAHDGRVLALELDVTDKPAIDRSVAAAHERFGRLDVVVNNAGYGQFGAIEEVGEEEARRQIETNLFGPLWMTKAAIPILREQHSGHILQVSSIGGVLAFPILGLYHASKWALEAFSQSLSEELEEFGVKVTIIEPGGYTTDWSGSSAGRSAELPAYGGAPNGQMRVRAASGDLGALERPVGSGAGRSVGA